MKTIIKSLSIIFIMAVFAIGGTVAYFSDIETSTGNTFTAGTLNLKVGENDPTTWKFNLPETIMPGDKGKEEAEIKNTGTIDGYLHISFANLKDEENNHIEPEIETANQNAENCEEEGGAWNTGSDPDNICDLKGDDSGELAENLEILIYIDGAGGIAGEFDLGIDELVYQGKVRGILQGDIFNYSLESNETIDFRVEWNLPFETGNVAQSDKAGFDIVFELTQHKKEIVGDWSFDENAGSIAYDESGYQNDGAIINGAAWTDGEYNPALEFNGVNHYVDCGNDSSLNITQGTWEAWLKFDALPSVVGLMNPLAKQEQYWIHASGDDSIQAKISVGGTKHISTAGANFIEIDKWYYVVGTYDSEILNLYVNGELKDSNTMPSGDIDTHNNILAIGTWSSLTDYFHGIINEVKIYSRALSSDEILENYNKGI